MRLPVLSIALLLCSACRFGFDYPLGDGDALAPDNPDPDTPDAPIGAGADPCPVDLAGTVALYTFDDDMEATFADSQGNNPGDLVGGTAVDYRDGPQGCGKALSFDASKQIYGQIDNTADWDLPLGSVDFWVWPADNGVLGDVAGILSRDALGTVEGGHFTVYQWRHTTPDSIMARIQSLGDGLGNPLCSTEPLQFGRWNHVGVNFGPPRTELWVNGVKTDEIMQIPGFDGVEIIDCNTPTEQGIDGNSNPWTVGVSTGLSIDGGTDGYFRPLTDGAIDHLRISNVRRNFAVMTTAARD